MKWAVEHYYPCGCHLLEQPGGEEMIEVRLCTVHLIRMAAQLKAEMSAGDLPSLTADKS